MKKVGKKAWDLGGELYLYKKKKNYICQPYHWGETFWIQIGLWVVCSDTLL